MKQVTDLGAIEAAVDAIIAANPDKVAQALGQAFDARMVRRTGDETDRRQGQSASRQRAAEGETRHLNALRISRSNCAESRFEALQSLARERFGAFFFVSHKKIFEACLTLRAKALKPVR